MAEVESGVSGAFKDELPERDLIESELGWRILRLPVETRRTRRGLLRWLALSLGLVNPKETRLSLLPILDALLHYSLKGEDVNLEGIQKYCENDSVFKTRVQEKTVRYHLTQLKKRGLVDLKRGRYRMSSSKFSNDPTVSILDYLDRNHETLKTMTQEALNDLAKSYL